jgi:hypothetical protein
VTPAAERKEPALLELARVRFVFEPADRLTAEEGRALDRLAVGGDERDRREESSPFRLQIVGEPWAPRQRDAAPGHTAEVEWEGGLVHVRHPTFLAVIDPSERTGRLWRGTREAYPLEITLRVALSSCLPFDGGLPIHAAGLVAEAGGLVFFGPSGAGKSTLAGLSPWPVLSDELVAVVPSPSSPTGFALVKTGFWGTLGEGNPPAGACPLAAIVELDKGRPFALERLSPTTALRRLIPSVLVPSGPPVWEAALAVLGRAVARVPAYRMTWSPDEPPWAALRELQSGTGPP